MVHRALEGRRGLKVQAEDEQRDGSGPPWRCRSNLLP